MSSHIRIVTLLVLSLLLQAVVPAFACDASMPAPVQDGSQAHAHHAMPADMPSQPTNAAHACCGGDGDQAGCAAGDCAMGGCLSVMLPASLLQEPATVQPSQIALLLAFLPLAPPTSRFRPPIA